MGGAGELAVVDDLEGVGPEDVAAGDGEELAVAVGGGGAAGAEEGDVDGPPAPAPQATGQPWALEDEGDVGVVDLDVADVALGARAGEELGGLVGDAGRGLAGEEDRGEVRWAERLGGPGVDLGGEVGAGAGPVGRRPGHVEAAEAGPGVQLALGQRDDVGAGGEHQHEGRERTEGAREDGPSGHQAGDYRDAAARGHRYRAACLERAASAR